MSLVVDKARPKIPDGPTRVDILGIEGGNACPETSSDLSATKYS